MGKPAGCQCLLGSDSHHSFQNFILIHVRHVYDLEYDVQLWYDHAHTILFTLQSNGFIRFDANIDTITLLLNLVTEPGAHGGICI